GVDLIVMASHGRTGPGRWLLGSVAEAVLREAPCPVLLVREALPVPLEGFHRILVALDGSERSLEVVPKVAALAAEGARAELLRASDLDALPLSMQEREVVLNALREELDGVTVPGLAVQRRVEDSSPAAAILAVAEREKCDLIAMTSHGRTGAARVLLGSVAERVARHAPCPVLIVPVKGVGL
ncbi:MAG: universal stress protein, partial [Candidatus Eremiobacterota bacterium]